MSHFAALAAALLDLVAAAGTAPEQPRQDLIHSDLPLWANGSEALWPRPFHDGDTFGCATRIEYGDWRYAEPGSDADPRWFRLTNYGAFHCFMMVRDGYERKKLAGRQADYSFLVQLGTIRGREGKIELWALQRGARPGSDYWLLARKPGPGAITAFDVLQRACPRDRVRRGPRMDILLTSYCAIDARRELVQLARRMSALPPLGRLTFVAAADDEE